MEIQPTGYPVSDYLEMLDRGAITVNRDYQRNPRIWPIAARSFLVETVLLNFPIPKLSLHQKTDSVTLKPHKEVVDGQQRSFALKDFMENKFRLSKRLDSSELHGKNFDDLSNDERRQFLNYGLNFDLFVGAEDAEVREIFRRMNTFTTPLNDEEQRNANFDGPFKWFVRGLTNEYADPFEVAGVFKEGALLRMSDAKLFTELAHAFFNGITTTNKLSLERVYKDNDEDFPEEADLGKRIREALDLVLSWTDLHGGPLFTRTYVFYSLVLAAMHLQSRVDALTEQIKLTPKAKIKEAKALSNLSALEAALIEGEGGVDDEDQLFAEFVEASTTKTNVAAQRITRTQWLCDALAKSFE
jgi:hypothetical protein